MCGDEQPQAVLRRTAERLSQAEATLESLLRGEVHLVIGTAQPMVARFKSLVEENERMAREWRVTFDATNSAVWILDKDWRILQSNKTAERFFGQSRPDLIGTIPCGKAWNRS